MRHTFQAHSSLPNFKFTCGVEGCCQTFTTYSAVKSHLARKHRGVNMDEAVNSPIQSQEYYPDTCSSEISAVQLTNDDMMHHTANPQPLLTSQENTLQRSAALFLLSLKEQHQNTQKAIDFAVGQVQQMMSYAIEDVKKSVMSTLQDHCPAMQSDIPDISSCFEVPNPFEALHTEYLQTKYYKNHFNLVVSLLTYLYIHQLLSVLCLGTNDH